MSDDTDYVYSPPDKNYLDKKANLILSVWKKFFLHKNEEVGKSGKDVLHFEEGFDKFYNVNNTSLIEVVAQVDKRVVYYKIFHKGMDISEAKTSGLYAYWINKLKPFSIADDKFNGKEYFPQEFIGRVNEEFAMFYLYTTLSNFAEKLAELAGAESGIRFDTSKMTPDLNNELIYSLRFRSVSQEATMLIAELLAGYLITGDWRNINKN